MVKKVIKREGHTEDFVKEKIVVSVIKAGASPEIARKIADTIEKQPEESIRTSYIRQHILDELKLHNPEWPKRWYNYDKNIKRLHKYGLK
ncbi:MAG: ATPase [Candidatus Thermoplasmatota archaeon]|nr:ATPase [Candidatus Thermoplasmatota archaeon]MBU1940843.1 ATPase [Candidatus Thermoplasmatota archaeon]